MSRAVKYVEWAVCCHEAGHAIVAAELGIPFNSVGLTIDRKRIVERGRLTHHIFAAVNTVVLGPEGIQSLREAVAAGEPLTKQDEELSKFAFALAVVKVAGPMAQRLLAPAYTEEANDEHDFEEAAELLDALEPGEPQAQREESMRLIKGAAENIIRDHSDKVRTLAKYAIGKRRVSPKKISQIFGLEVRVHDVGLSEDDMQHTKKGGAR